MQSFTDFESLYKHLEDHALDYKYPHQIGNLFQWLRDVKNQEKKPQEVEKAQWEIDFFNFPIEQGTIKIIRINEKGEISEYRNLSELDETQIQYLTARLDSTANPLLKARYAHILWCSPKKHTKHAMQAVDAYLELMKIYEGKDKALPKEHFGLDVLRTIQNTYFIGRQVNHKLDVIRAELIRLVKEFNFESTSYFVMRASIIDMMLKDKKHFLKDHFRDFEDICCNVSEKLAKEGNLHGSIDMLELGKRIDRKTEQSTHEWEKKIARSYEGLMQEAEKNGNLASLTFCQEAIERYKALKNEEKCNELENKYSDLKKGMKLQAIVGEIDLTEQAQRSKDLARRIAQRSPEEIIKILIMDKRLLPKYKDMEKKAEENFKNFVFPNVASTEIIDQSGHTAQHFSDDNEKKHYWILYEYNLHIKLSRILLINEIFLEALRKEKLSSEIVADFLQKHSWYGKSFEKKMPDGETIAFNWLGFLAPAIHEYFYQMRIFLLNPATNHPNFILTIDSLILKLEGLVRDLCEFSGITTFYTTKDNKGRNLVKEKDINALLYDEDIKKLLDEDELLFLRYLLIEKAGLNLRNKIAHSLVNIHDYNFESMGLLMLALLRLARYDFVSKNDEKGQSPPEESNPRPINSDA